ncbi:patatin-like phospholipase family protein [Candidatus Saganbacteria bacterium]|nr:patatin-like phospholipase family protein [Candidatus Saganbacteria bacterium]
MFWLGRKKIGLALGGGVARGIAHVGVLRVIEESRLPVEYVAATSAGAIIGAVYAAGLSLARIEELALKIRWSKILKLAFFRPGLITSQVIEDLIIEYIGDKDFKELKIPLAVVATDLKTGGPVIIRSGSVARAVSASASFPGLFSPVIYNSQHLIDGGLAYNLPVSVVRELGANFVIASDVIPAIPPHHLPQTPLHVFGRALDILLNKLSFQERKLADILIEPHYSEDIYPFDMHKARKLIAAGEIAAHKALKYVKI